MANVISRHAASDPLTKRLPYWDVSRLELVTAIQGDMNALDSQADLVKKSLAYIGNHHFRREAIDDVNRIAIANREAHQIALFDPVVICARTAGTGAGQMTTDIRGHVNAAAVAARVAIAGDALLPAGNPVGDAARAFNAAAAGANSDDLLKAYVHAKINHATKTALGEIGQDAALVEAISLRARTNAERDINTRPPAFAVAGTPASAGTIADRGTANILIDGFTNAQHGLLTKINAAKALPIGHIDTSKSAFDSPRNRAAHADILDSVLTKGSHTFARLRTGAVGTPPIAACTPIKDELCSLVVENKKIVDTEKAKVEAKRRKEQQVADKESEEAKREVRSVERQSQSELKTHKNKKAKELAEAGTELKKEENDEITEREPGAAKSAKTVAAGLGVMSVGIAGAAAIAEVAALNAAAAGASAAAGAAASSAALATGVTAAEATAAGAAAAGGVSTTASSGAIAAAVLSAIGIVALVALIVIPIVVGLVYYYNKNKETTVDAQIKVNKDEQRTLPGDLNAEHRLFKDSFRGDDKYKGTPAEIKKKREDMAEAAKDRAPGFASDALKKGIDRIGSVGAPTR